MEGEDGGGVPIVPVEIQFLILNYAESVTLVGRVQLVCKAWQDIASKILRRRQEALIREVGLEQPPERKYKILPLWRPSITLLHWNRIAAEILSHKRDQRSGLFVVIQEEGQEKGEAPKAPKDRKRYESKVSQRTGQQVYHGDILQQFFNEANRTGVTMSHKCKDQLNIQAFQELIKMMVLASSLTIRQEWSFSRTDGDVFEDNYWSCSFYFIPNITSASWASVWENKTQTSYFYRPRGEDKERRVMSLRFQYQQNTRAEFGYTL